MRKIIFKVYNVFCYIYSWFVNILLLIENKRRDINCYNYNSFMYKRYLEKIRELRNNNVLGLLKEILSFGEYKPDPIIPFKIFGASLTVNFIPFFKTFFIRKGGDCSIFATITQIILNKMKIKNKLYLIVENKKNFWESIETAHIVCLFHLENYMGDDEIYISNNGIVVRMDNEGIEFVSEEEAIKKFLSGMWFITQSGIKFSFQNFSISRWF